MKKFFVSKSDKNRVCFIKNVIKEIKPNNIFIICENERAKIYEGIEALILPLKDLNKAPNWIEFTKNINENCLLVIDNVLKCIYFGDGKKKYLKNISQSLKHIIITDVVPFYTEPHEIFYPFYLLGKSILGYGSYNSFKGNPFEEKQDGSIDIAHSFLVLKDKIKDYYIQDYKCFWNKRTLIEWEMSSESRLEYEKRKLNALDKYNNPIQLMTAFADYVNLLPEKANIIKSLINGKTCLVLNYMPYSKKIKSFFDFNSFDILSYHETDITLFNRYDTIILYENIIVKRHKIFYLENNFKGAIYNLLEKTTGIDKNLYNSIYNIKLRNEFDKYFGNE